MNSQQELLGITLANNLDRKVAIIQKGVDRLLSAALEP